MKKPPKTPPKQRLFKPKELADYFGKSVATIAYHRRVHALPMSFTMETLSNWNGHFAAFGRLHFG